MKFENYDIIQLHHLLDKYVYSQVNDENELNRKTIKTKYKLERNSSISSLYIFNRSKKTDERKLSTVMHRHLSPFTQRMISFPHIL